jgi:hypothetical protein
VKQDVAHRLGMDREEPPVLERFKADPVAVPAPGVEVIPEGVASDFGQGVA